MSEVTFRIIVAISVAAAVLAFVVQAALLVALFGVSRNLKREFAGSSARLGSAFGKVEPIINQAEIVIAKTELVIDSSSGAAVKVRSGLDRCRPIVDRTIVVSRQVEVLMRNIGQAAGATQQIVQQLSHGVTDIGGEVRAIVRSVRAQAADVDGLLHDAGGRVRRRLDQIDQAVDRTVRVEGLPTAVLRPVRAVNGVVAGVSAAVAVLRQSAGLSIGSSPKSNLKGA